MTSVCRWCREPVARKHFRGKLENVCGCNRGFRSTVEERRDAIFDRYGSDPAAYTPAVLKRMAADGVLDIAAAFCPAGKLSMAETRAREAANLLPDRA